MDGYDSIKSGLDSPASNVAIITPNDEQDLHCCSRGIAFATNGTLRIETHKRQIVTIPKGVLSPGVIHQIRIKRVYSSGTTVKHIVIFW